MLPRSDAPTPGSPATTSSSNHDLARRLEELTLELTVPGRAPVDEAGEPASLVALLPCEPVVGAVVVVCWTAADGSGGEAFELVRLSDGTPITDHTALRESLTLLAMAETLEELAAVDQVPVIRTELEAWGGDHLQPGEAPDAPLATSIDAALGALDALATLAPTDDAPRLATTTVLDTLGAALRDLDTAWGRLEQAAEGWSDAQMAAAEEGAAHEAAFAAVQEL